ncbi:hypothetical protein O3P69_019113 [Scylla paramamosain]|uniref:Uncharacterized protein n=1 Tax=Scylla paramamosain TaxID=85552 RepID=A0AAW0SUF2_SCYPA
MAAPRWPSSGFTWLHVPRNTYITAPVTDTSRVDVAGGGRAALASEPSIFKPSKSRYIGWNGQQGGNVKGTLVVSLGCDCVWEAVKCPRWLQVIGRGRRGMKNSIYIFTGLSEEEEEE